MTKTTTTPDPDTAPGSASTGTTPGIASTGTTPGSASTGTTTPGTASTSGAYAYQARELLQPTPAQVRAARLLCGQTQAAAAALVYRDDSARWRAWERDPSQAGRIIDLAIWELYLIKSGLRVNT